ncbi:MAG: DUF2442 domain-containing protein [Synergistaceae bacterium]|nr:DUF2442 domain-containing protein [Synergistaceae bacterium]
MYELNGIVYADDPTPLPKVCGVRPLPEYKLWIRFDTGEAKIFDCKRLLDYQVFAPLKDVSFFNSVYIDYHTTVWDDGNIDIDPEMLYEEGEDCEGLGTFSAPGATILN